ncbi:MAG: ketoacyl reductase [Verrucomicrobia bacterium]|nr:MAG: ketoacyl reductase [Verrucomicrobiota bacterium]
MRRATAIAMMVVGAWLASRAWRSRFSFSGKVALISGGSRGLGLILARQISSEGGKVALLARDADELERAKAELIMRGGEVLAVQCDLLERSQIQAAVAEILTCYGKIDVLFNNAGIIQVGPVENMQQQDFERAMSVHFWAPLLLIMEVLPAMRARRCGRIINICSIGGKVAVPHLVPYCASKFALTGLSDALRAELARDNISVTTVAPGLIRTGSHVNAKFKGQHDAEFAWFSASSGMPLISMSGERAGRKILAAARCGQPSLTLTFAARGAIVANALFPNLTGQAMKIGNRFLPGLGSQADANDLRAGHQTRRIAPEWMTDLADRASAKNYELR